MFTRDILPSFNQTCSFTLVNFCRVVSLGIAFTADMISFFKKKAKKKKKKGALRELEEKVQKRKKKEKKKKKIKKKMCNSFYLGGATQTPRTPPPFLL